MAKSVTDKNVSYLHKTIQLREQLEGGFLLLAERLKKIRDERMFRDEYDSFEDFLREIRISPATASKLIGVYEKFVILGDIAPEDLIKQGWTNLSIFLPLITSKKNAREIYDKVAPLDRTDAMRVYEEMKRGVDMGTCPHGDTYALEICRDCGIRMEKHED